MLVLFAAFSFWLSRAGSQRPTAHVVSERSVGFVRFAPASNDPGVRALRRELQTRVEAELRRGDPLPTPFRWLLSGIAERLVPAEFTLSFEPPVEGERPELLAAFNPKGYTRLLSFFIGVLGSPKADGSSPPPYRGATIHRLHDRSYWVFLEGTGLTASSLSALLRGIDRLQEVEDDEGRPRRGAGPVEDVRLPPPPEGGWDLTGWFVDGAALVRQMEEDDRYRDLAEALAQAGPVAFGVDFETEDRLTGKLWAEAPSPAAAERLADAFRRGFAERGGPQPDATLTVSTSGTRVEVHLRADGLADPRVGVW